MLDSICPRHAVQIQSSRWAILSSSKSERLKIIVLEVFMTPARRIHELGKLSLLAKTVEKRIGYEISIKKKIQHQCCGAARAARKNYHLTLRMPGRSLHCLGVAHSALIYRGLQYAANCGPLRFLVLDAKAEGLSDLRLEKRTIEVEGMSKIFLCLLPVTLVIVSKSTIKHYESYVVCLWETCRETVCPR